MKKQMFKINTETNIKLSEYLPDMLILQTGYIT